MPRICRDASVRVGTVLVPLVPLVTGLSACAGEQGSVSEPGLPDASVNIVSVEHGRELFARQCAVCHGELGDGQGTAAYLLSPVPRDFGSGRFRLVSTVNSVPSQADLVRMLERGMPGSAMPPFDWLSVEERESLGLYVRQLAREGIVRGLELYAEEEGEEFDPAEAQAIALERTTPGAPVELGTEPETSAAELARGRELYVVSCAPCHGSDGKAREVDVQWNEDGTPTRPRDFTAGIFKGDATRAEIVRRLRCGLPGSPMPSTELARPADAWALASYVLSLVRPGAQERVLQRRQRLVAHRVKALPATAEAREWQAIEPTWLALMPLWWRDERVEGVELRAVHDGERVAFHFAWKDRTKDEELLGTETFSDLVALQISAEGDLPLFTMGEAGKPVNIWSWKAAWERELQAPRDVGDRYPNLSADLHGYQPEAVRPLYLTARAVGNPVASAGRCCAGEELSAQGFGTLAPLVAGTRTLDVHGGWRDGEWRVVFTRDLAADAPEVVALEPGRLVHLAAAVWDGAASDRNGQKSVTVWHELVLEK